MAKLYDEITPELVRWIGRQRMFFVATAPLAAEGHVNCSPKGLDSFRMLTPNRVAYLDLTGSGAETIAHVRENGRIVLMFCAFEGSPNIVRLHGNARVVQIGDAGWDALYVHFRPHPGARAIIDVEVTRIADSCGYAVPRYDFVAERDVLDRWTEQRGAAGVVNYRREKNAVSIDGLTAFTPGSD